MIVNVLKRKNINTNLISEFVQWFHYTYVQDERVSYVIDVNARVENNGNCSCPLASDNIVSINIELNRTIALASDEYLLYILGHELWHARQYVKGLLKDTDDEMVSIWRGKTIDESTMNYSDLPWEKDAFRNEKKVNKKWKKVVEMCA